MATKKKTPVPKFYGTIVVKDKHHAFKLKNSYYYQRYIDNAFKAGQEVSITIKRQYRNRTTGNKLLDEEGNQNGYLYAVVLPLVSDVTGYSIDEACDALETMLCKQSDNEYGMPRILRFKEMTTVEFNHYVIDAENPDSVRSWALRVLDLDIPEPDKEWRNKGYEADYGETGENNPSPNK